MTKRGSKYENPKFKNADEEDRYWETHSPLAEGYEGRVQASTQKMSSFLSVRMSGEELAELRDAAASFGMKPSAYARLILRGAVGQNTWGVPNPLMPPPLLFPALYQRANEEALQAELGKRPTETHYQETIENIEKTYNTFLMKQKILIDTWLMRHNKVGFAQKQKESQVAKFQPD